MKCSQAISTFSTVLLLLLWVPSSWAWEMKIQSALFSFRYLYASQTGNRGFFGPYNVDMGSTEGDLASLNGWFQKDMVSGSTGELSRTRLAIFPILQVNPAVAVCGTFQIGPLLPD